MYPKSGTNSGSGKKAILFNPAKANFKAYGLDAAGYNGEMTSYIVDKEVLNEILKYLPLKTVDNKVIIDEEGFWQKVYYNTPLGSFYKMKDNIDDHSISSVIEGLSKGEEEKWKEELKYLIKTLIPVASFFF